MRWRMPSHRTVLKSIRSTGTPSSTLYQPPCTTMPTRKSRSARLAALAKTLVRSSPGRTRKEIDMLTPETQRKNGMTKSARCMPFHGAWSIEG